MVRTRPTRRKRPDLRPGEVVRLPRRIIDAVLAHGTDDRVLVREVHARAVYVESIQCPGAAWYVRRSEIYLRFALPRSRVCASNSTFDAVTGIL
ncbi:hypothetical protein LBMAG48_14210 [Phycisphaerae bacterium]|nr:hypothetical protein LBMAG48_14210 [Phycisphaerae bacterium]